MLFAKLYFFRYLLVKCSRFKGQGTPHLLCIAPPSLNLSTRRATDKLTNRRSIQWSLRSRHGKRVFETKPGFKWPAALPITFRKRNHIHFPYYKSVLEVSLLWEAKIDSSLHMIRWPSCRTCPRKANARGAQMFHFWASLNFERCALADWNPLYGDNEKPPTMSYSWRYDCRNRPFLIPLCTPVFFLLESKKLYRNVPKCCLSYFPPGHFF